MQNNKSRPAVVLAVLMLAGPAMAQQQSEGPWRVPGEIQPPKGPWQVPGEIRQPKGPWLVPKGIQAVRSSEAKCERRVSVVADALFDFDRFDLRNDAAETLAAVGPEIARAGRHPMVVEGHTDAIGTDAYNLTLSEQRARTVRDWLAGRGFMPAGTAIKGYGRTRPVAPDRTSDGRDSPENRQKNRRVEIAINTCG